MNDNRDYIVGYSEKGTYNISPEVIATVAADASCEVEGVAGISAGGKEIVDIRTNKKSALRGVKINYEDNMLFVDVNIAVDINAAIEPTSKKVQEAVINAVEATTGLKVGSVNIRVSGLNIDK